MIAHIARININHLLKLLVRNSIAGLKRSMTKKTTNIIPIIILEWAKKPQMRCLSCIIFKSPYLLNQK